MVSQNSTNEIIPENNFTVQRTVTTAGTNVLLEVQHTDTSSTNSNAIIEAKTLAGGGDAVISSNLNANQWTWGQSFGQTKLFESTGLPSTGVNLREMTTAGAQTLPIQPSFSAYLNTAILNATGDGTFVQPIIFDTVLGNRSGSYSTGTGLFTAPVTGVYQFNATVYLASISAAHTSGGIDFYINAQIYLGGLNNTASIRDFNNTASYNQSFTAFMTAGQTCSVAIVVSNGTKTVEIVGLDAGSITTAFSGCLLA